MVQSKLQSFVLWYQEGTNYVSSIFWIYNRFFCYGFSEQRHKIYVFSYSYPHASTWEVLETFKGKVKKGNLAPQFEQFVSQVKKGPDA